MGAFLKRILDPHLKIERFGALFILLASVLFVSAGASLVLSGVEDTTALATTSRYTTSFDMSKTGTTADVERVFASDDKTKAFCLLHFDDVSAISTNAQNWSVFLTDANVAGNPSPMAGLPAGSVYVFGNTGYIGVYLVNVDGFAEQVLEATLRAQTEIVSGDGEVPKDKVDDASFSKYDQGVFLFNPGASGAEPLPCLNADEAPGPEVLYAQSVAAYQEADLRVELDSTLSEMRTELAACSEYEGRLAQEGLVVPERPAAMAGDVVDVDASGRASLSSDVTLSGGWSFDWRNGSILTGYLDALKAEYGMEGVSDAEFLTFVQTGDDATASISSSDYDWTFTNGSRLADLASGTKTTQRYGELTRLTADVTRSWSDYLSSKDHYEVDLLGELLELEASVRAEGASTTVNADCVVDY